MPRARRARATDVPPGLTRPRSAVVDHRGAGPAAAETAASSSTSWSHPGRGARPTASFLRALLRTASATRRLGVLSGRTAPGVTRRLAEVAVHTTEQLRDGRLESSPEPIAKRNQRTT